jgi:hypothetical protein
MDSQTRHVAVALPRNMYFVWSASAFSLLWRLDSRPFVTSVVMDLRLEIETLL